MSSFTLKNRRSRITVNGNIIIETRTFSIIGKVVMIAIVKKTAPNRATTFFNAKIGNKYYCLFSIGT